MEKKDNKLSIEEQDTLWKAMEDLDFSKEEIDAKKEEVRLKDEAIEKAAKPKEEKEEADPKEEKEEKEDKDDKAVDKKEEKPDEDDMEKAMSGIKEMFKGIKEHFEKIEKAMTTLEDKQGKLPLVNQSSENSDLKKSEDAPIEKAVVAEEDDLMKAFGAKFDTLNETILGLNSKIEKAEEDREKMESTFNEYLDSPLTNKKPLANDYALIEKGEKVNDKGKRVLSLSRNKQEILKSLNDCFEKSENVEESKILESGIFQTTCGGIMAAEAAKILQRDMDVEFEA